MNLKFFYAIFCALYVVSSGKYANTIGRDELEKYLEEYRSLWQFVTLNQIFREIEIENFFIFKNPHKNTEIFKKLESNTLKTFLSVMLLKILMTICILLVKFLDFI